jgi:hypothetical protein
MARRSTTPKHLGSPPQGRTIIADITERTTKDPSNPWRLRSSFEVSIGDGPTVVRGGGSHPSKMYWAVIDALRNAYGITTAEARDVYGRLYVKRSLVSG